MVVGEQFGKMSLQQSPVDKFRLKHKSYAYLERSYSALYSARLIAYPNITVINIYSTNDEWLSRQRELLLYVTAETGGRRKIV